MAITPKINGINFNALLPLTQLSLLEGEVMSIEGFLKANNLDASGEHIIKKVAFR